MANWKRQIYGHPLLRIYRDWRSQQLAHDPRPTPYGFTFSGFDIYHSPSWEPCEREIISSYLDRSQVLIDCGASHGYYSCMAASAGLHVAAVEAEHSSFQVLLENIRRNGFTDCELFHVGISGSMGTHALYSDGDMASLDHEWTDDSDKFQQLVATNTLDNLFGDRWEGQQIFIKIDVEGFEDKVLAGASRLLSRDVKPIWLIETFPQPPDSTTFRFVFESMRRHGYYASVVDHNATPVNDRDVERWSNDMSEPGRSNSNFLFRSSTSD